MEYAPVSRVMAPHIAMQLERYIDGLFMRSKNMLLLNLGYAEGGKRADTYEGACIITYPR